MKDATSILLEKRNAYFAKVQDFSNRLNNGVDPAERVFRWNGKQAIMSAVMVDIYSGAIACLLDGETPEELVAKAQRIVVRDAKHVTATSGDTLADMMNDMQLSGTVMLIDDLLALIEKMGA